MARTAWAPADVLMASDRQPKPGAPYLSRLCAVLSCPELCSARLRKSAAEALQDPEMLSLQKPPDFPCDGDTNHSFLHNRPAAAHGPGRQPAAQTSAQIPLPARLEPARGSCASVCP